VDAVAAVSRSGLLPGGLLASALHVPAYTVSQGSGVSDPGHGLRMKGRRPTVPRHVLLIDDTAANGTEMAACAPIVRAAFPGAALTRAVVYAHPNALLEVDLFARLYPGQHYLEWNWPNAGHGQACGYDFDGILCRNFTPEEVRTDEIYFEVMARIDPLFLPRRTMIPLVVTARPEASRGITLEWLARYGVRVERLVMRDFDIGPGEDWDARNAVFKACHYGRSDLNLFAESEPPQALEIARLTGKAVLCPALGRVIPPTQAPKKARVSLGSKPAYG
jgi:hypothetical protein